MSARVLVVDDLPVNVKLLEARLTLEYYDVLTANDGRTAIEIAKTDQPDIILLDVMMPEMDGYQVCRALKDDPVTEHIPVVMVTALDATRDRVEGVEAGADDFLSKPVNDTAMFARISSLVRLKRACDEWRAREATAVELGVIDTATEEDAGQHGNILLAKPGMWGSETVSEFMTEAGHQVEVAETEEDLLALSGFGECDLVIVGDSDGNGSDALRLCSQLRSQPDSRHVPILLVADEGKDERLAKALELGINDYLMRPVDRDELFARARSQIRRARYEARLRQTYMVSVNAAVTDSLTGLYNRRYLDSHFERLEARLKSGSKCISTVMIDIDHFKRVNDDYGHDAGDGVLQAVANKLKDNLRGFDTAIRLGGEEFVIVMPDCSSHVATVAANRLRRSIEEMPVALLGGEGQISVTVSGGVATTIAGEKDIETLLREADTALYEAKENGRNQIIAADGAEAAAEVSTKVVA